MKKIVVLLLWGMAVPLMAQGTEQVDSIRLKLAEVTAQTYTSRLDLSLLEAQDFAVRQNRALLNAGLDVKKAHAQRWQTIAAMLPQADFSTAYTNMCGYKMDIAGMEMQMPAYMTANITASLGLNGQAIVGALLQNIAIEMQDITRDQTETELRANVVKSYMAVLVMEQIVSLMDSNLVNIKRLALQTANMAQVGVVEQTQADQMQVRVLQTRDAVQQYRRSVILAYNALRVLLNVDSSTELALTSSLDEIMSPENALGILFEDWNINNNHNYQLLEKNVELAEKNIHMAGWAYGPTLSFAYQYSYRKNFDEGGFNMTPPNMIVATVSMPIWSSGKRASGITEKKIALQQARNTLDETRDNLVIQYNQLRYNLANAYETYRTQKENLEVSRRIFGNITNKYNWGASSSVELTQAHTDYLNAQTSYVNAVMDLVNADVELKKFMNNK